MCAAHPPPPTHTSCFHEWQAGISLFAVGNILNFVSFGFAAQSLLAALGSVQFVSNVVFARFVLGERVTWRVLGATALIVGGCILLVSFGSHASDLLKASQLVRAYGNPAYITYLVFMFVGVGLSYWLYRAGKKAVANPATPPRARSRWHRSLPISYAAFSGLLGTQSVLFCKALSTLLRTTLHGKSQLGSWFFWVSLLALALTAVFWVSRLNKGLRLFPATVIVPTMQISWTLFSIVSGMIYYREYRSFTTLSALMFAGGVGLVFVGVWLLTPAGRDVDADAAAAGGTAAASIDPLNATAAAATPAAIVAVDKLGSDGKPGPPSRTASPVPSRRTVSPDGRPPSTDGGAAAPVSPGATSAAVLGSAPTPSAPWSDVPLGTSPDGRAGVPPPALSAGAASPPRAAASDRARLRRRSCNSFVADIVHDFSMDARSSVRPLLGLGPPGDMAAVSLFSVPYESRLPTGGGGVFAASPAASAVLASPEASDVEGGGTGSSAPAVVVRPVGRWSAPGDVERGAASGDGSTPRTQHQQRPPDMDALAAAAAAAAARSRLPSRAPRTTRGRSPGAPPRRGSSGGDVELLPPAAAAWAGDAVRTAPPPPRPPPKE